MNILFLTMADFESIEKHSLYTDLLRCFRNNGNEVYVITPNEKRFGKDTELVHEKGAHILHIKTGDVTASGNMISKGIAQVSIEPIFINAAKKYFSNIKFDLVLYSTPPITLCKAVEYIKKRDGAKTYLLLKDIFPQNAVDLGLMSKSGMMGILFRHFRHKEKRLYSLSDYIGCMSPGNVEYILKNNPEILPEKVEVCPNSIEITDKSISNEERISLRMKYDIPVDKTVFVYGGNLGKPQGIPFLINCLQLCKNIKSAYFLIVGDGTEYSNIEEFIKKDRIHNIKLMKQLSKEDYDTLAGACDVGLIFLDHRFTIPNFPSRLLAYMQAKLPVLAATDLNTDIGNIIVEAGFGWWCESKDAVRFKEIIDLVCESDLGSMRENSYKCLKEQFDVEKAYHIIMKHMGEKR